MDGESSPNPIKKLVKFHFHFSAPLTIPICWLYLTWIQSVRPSISKETATGGSPPTSLPVEPGAEALTGDGLPSSSPPRPPPNASSVRHRGRRRRQDLGRPHPDLARRLPLQVSPLLDLLCSHPPAPASSRLSGHLNCPSRRARVPSVVGPVPSRRQFVRRTCGSCFLVIQTPHFPFA